VACVCLVHTEASLYAQGKIERLLANEWPRAYGKQTKAHATRHRMAGVEIRTLQAPHPLAGEQVTPRLAGSGWG
jgi:hypothetical protein